MKKIMSFIIGALCLLAVAGCESSNGGNTNGQLSLRKLKMDKYVTLGEYKGLEVEKTEIEIPEEMIQDRMLAIIGLNLSEYGIKDRAARKGDRVVCNLNVYVDGIAVTSASSSGETFVIGDNSMIDEVDNAFVGMNVGETKNVEVEYPADYADAKFAGKTAVLRLELVAIYPDQITDSMVASLDSLIYTTVDELHKYCEDALKKNAEKTAQSDMKNQLLTIAYNNATFNEIPAKYLEEQKSMVRSNFTYTAGLYGLTEDEYVEFMYEMTVDELAEKYLKQRMLIEAIAQKEGLSYTDKEYNEEIAKAAESQGVSVDNYFLLNNLTNDERYIETLTSNRVTELIVNNAIIK